MSNIIEMEHLEAISTCSDLFFAYAVRAKVDISIPTHKQEGDLKAIMAEFCIVDSGESQK